MNSNDEFFSFVNAIELNNVPWERLICTNGRATDIPKLLTQLASLDPNKAPSALRDLSLQIEHQETVWTAAPFALIFMGRCGDQIRASEPKMPKLQSDLSEYFQELLDICTQALSYYDSKEQAFSSWQEFFNEEHLLPPINYEELCADEDDDGEYEEELDWEEDLPDSPTLVLSCYEYSKRILEFYLNKWNEPLTPAQP